MWGPQLNQEPHGEKRCGARRTAQAVRDGTGANPAAPPPRRAEGLAADRRQQPKSSGTRRTATPRAETDRARGAPRASRSREELRSAADTQAGDDKNSRFRQRPARGEADRAGAGPNSFQPKAAGATSNRSQQQQGQGQNTFGGYNAGSSSESFGGANWCSQQAHEDKKTSESYQRTSDGAYDHGRAKPAASTAQNVPPGERTCYYKILGVHPKATDEDIKKAYRSKAMEWHPDKNAHRKEESERMFKEIGESYEVLRDPQLRSLYDTHGFEGPRANVPQGPRAQPQYQFHSARDIFAEFFGGEDPFSNFGFGGSIFGHRDPFSMLFGDPIRTRGGNWVHAQPNPFASPFFSAGASRLGRLADDFSPAMSFLHGGDSFSVFGNDPFFSGGHMFGGMETSGRFGTLPAPNSGTSMSYSFFGDNGETRQTTTSFVNGQRTVTTKITDSQGNVSITQEFPNGQKTTTVNGIPSTSMLPGAQQTQSRHVGNNGGSAHSVDYQRFR